MTTFAAEVAAFQTQQQSFQLAQRSQAYPLSQAYPVQGHTAQSQSSEDELSGGEMSIPLKSDLEFQESAWEETVLTATYEILGSRSVPPSNTTRRYKIATIMLKDVRLTYAIVPKLRQAAFLMAHSRTDSPTTLLNGPAGLTLDGSFLGTATLPRCSSGDTFSLNLGADPSINVVYQKPSVHRSQTGVFPREGSNIYVRTLTILNTRMNRVIEGIVLDQIPVSEDDRLRVDVLQPSGLKSVGDHAMSETATTTVARVLSGNVRGSIYSVDGTGDLERKGDKWGNALATLKRYGEVSWDLKLSPGQGVRLTLEYRKNHQCWAERAKKSLVQNSRE